MLVLIKLCALSRLSGMVGRPNIMGPINRKVVDQNIRLWQINGSKEGDQNVCQCLIITPQRKASSGPRDAKI